MYPKDLVVFLEEGLAYQRRVVVAAEIAARWQAHLIAIFAARPPLARCCTRMPPWVPRSSPCSSGITTS